MRKYFTAFLLLLGGCLHTAAQNTPTFNVNLTPPSPEVANLGKYGELPVNLATGTPGISVPLYVIRTGGFELPVSLNYHAGGIRVEEMASPCGLGWSLAAGGSVSRTVRGNRDEYPGEGYLDNNRTFSNVNSFYAANSTGGLMGAPLVNFLQSVAAGVTDLEPDVFQYNLPGASGTFFLSREDQKAHPQVFNNLRFVYDRTNFQGITGGFSQWKITDEKGVIYVFGKNLQGSTAFVENTGTISVFNGSRGTGKSNYTAWFLTDIILPKNADTIHFDYMPVLNKYNNRVNETLYEINVNNTAIDNEYAYSESSSNTFQISSIYGRFGKVQFNYDTLQERQDLKGSFALKSMEVFDYTGIPVKKYAFNTSYFVSDVPAPTGTIYDTYNRYRLKLDSIAGVTPAASKRLYAFEYDYNPSSRKIPYRLSYSQDFWGYYNGKTNTTMVPRYPDLTGNSYIAMNAVSEAPRYLAGAVRSPSPEHTRIGTMTRMYYPTGGFSDFEYELNEAYAEDFDHEMGIPGEQEVAEQSYASLTSNTILNPSYPGNVQESNFSIDAGAFRRNVNFLRLDIDNPNECEYENRTNACGTKIELIKPSGEVVLLPNRGTRYMWALSGQYTVRLTIASKTNPNAQNVSITITGPAAQSKLYNKKLGGLRIRSIKHYDGITGEPATVKQFRYNQYTDTSRSSGFFNYPGNFYYEVRAGGTNANGPYSEEVFARTASSNYPLVMQHGSPVMYGAVDILEDNATQKLKTSHSFAVSGDDFAPTLEYPAGPVLKHEYKRGQLLSQKDFLYAGGNFTLQREKVSVYDYAVNGGVNAFGIEGVKVHTLMRAGPLPVKQYIERTGWANQIQNVETYYKGGTGLENKTDFLYENTQHNLLTSQHKFTGNQEMVRQKTRYVQDYSLPANVTPDEQVTALKQLRDNNLYIPIEVITITKKANGSEYVVGGSITTYDSSTLNPAVVYQLELDQPQPLAAFVQSAVTAEGRFIKDSHYKEVGRYVLFDARNNVLQLRKAGDIPVSYLWDYRLLYQSCKADNAAYADIAATSFEADGKGQFSFAGQPVAVAGAPTGRKAYALSAGNITRTGLAAGKTYTVSYWSSSGAQAVNGSMAIPGRILNGWTYYEHRVVNPAGGAITISGSGTIDELRLYPEGAVMTTFTYDPLTGVTSQCDAGNRVTYYEYDELKRLKCIRDQDKNIVKKICYNYAGEPENCN